ncbi:MAG: tRNA adenosine(34) deaminase TadA, partial [Gammaproteobacteria bacterium]|nr:tRNA adenosine(34) deaminase TadA [Gammaproteobacteria bacterium]
MTDEEWMQQAIVLASKAEQQGEVPVGAVLVKDGEVVGE